MPDKLGDYIDNNDELEIVLRKENMTVKSYFYIGQIVNFKNNAKKISIKKYSSFFWLNQQNIFYEKHHQENFLQL